MLFNKGKRYITSTYQLLASANRYYYFKVRKSDMTDLELNIKSTSGDFRIIVKNDQGFVVIDRSNPKNGVHRFRLEVGKKYEVRITVRHYSGQYSLYLVKNQANLVL